MSEPRSDFKILANFVTFGSFEAECISTLAREAEGSVFDLQSCSAPTSRKDAMLPQAGPDIFSRLEDITYSQNEDFQGVHQRRARPVELPFLYRGAAQAQTQASALQASSLPYLHRIQQGPPYQQHMHTISNCGTLGQQHTGPLDAPYCFSSLGLNEVDFKIGGVRHASSGHEPFRTACGSQSVDSEGTIAGHLSRPGSSEVGQDHGANPEAWSAYPESITHSVDCL